MKRSTGILAAAGAVMAFGVLSITTGQETSDDDALNRRILELEMVVARLSATVQQRTDVTGPQDRVSRDYNLDRRLDNIELSVEQLERNVMDLNRQLSSVSNTASQAQQQAQRAEQMARDLSFRLN